MSFKEQKSDLIYGNNKLNQTSSNDQSFKKNFPDIVISSVSAVNQSKLMHLLFSGPLKSNNHLRRLQPIEDSSSDEISADNSDYSENENQPIMKGKFT